MKALVYHGDHDIKLEEVGQPSIQTPKDAIVKIVKTTICGTDLGIYKGKNLYMKDGTILGHEGVGIIEEVGDGVVNFKKGDKVIISCITSCGTCDNCKKQLYAHCKDGGWILWHLINGTQAEYVRIPYADNSLYKLPQNIDDETAVMISDALPTGFEIGVLNGKVQPGDAIAIVGAGPVGFASLLTAQFFSPSVIIVVDLDDNRLDMALKAGATHVINSGKEDVAARVKEITGGDGVDVAIEAVGLPPTLTVCADIVKPGGNVANVGVHGKPVELKMEELWIKNINISMGLVNSNTIPQLIKAVGSNKINVGSLITHKFSLGEIEKAYDVFLNSSREHSMKVIVAP